MLTDLMRCLPGNRPDTFLDPDHCHYFGHDQSQTEPRKYTNATKEEENAVVAVLNEAVRLATFSSYFSVNKYLISVHLEQGSFLLLWSYPTALHTMNHKKLFSKHLFYKFWNISPLNLNQPSLYYRPKFTFGKGKYFHPHEALILCQQFYKRAQVSFFFSHPLP